MGTMKPFWLGVLGSIVGFMVMTGMSFFWQDVFTVDRSGTIDFRVSNTGNIGIGMQGAMDIPGSRLVVKASGTGTTSSALDVQASNGTSRLFVRDDGNIGIGTTSPAAPFVVQANSLVTGDTRYSTDWRDTSAFGLGVGGGFHVSAKYNSAGNFAGLGSVKVFKENATDGDPASAMAFMTRTNAGGESERVRITSTGNVGIGTTVPTSKLHVVGLPLYANNAAAIAGGLTAGAFYRTGGDPDLVCVVH